MKNLMSIILAFFVIAGCSGSNKWSAFQGKMKWEDAMKKCESLGMRLPTIEDLKTAYAAREIDLWEIYGVNYWSSTTNSNSRAFVLFLDGGREIDSSRFIDYAVRCIR